MMVTIMHAVPSTVQHSGLSAIEVRQACSFSALSGGSVKACSVCGCVCVERPGQSSVHDNTTNHRLTPVSRPVSVPRVSSSGHCWSRNSLQSHAGVPQVSAPGLVAAASVFMSNRSTNKLFVVERPSMRDLSWSRGASSLLTAAPDCSASMCDSTTMAREQSCATTQSHECQFRVVVEQVVTDLSLSVSCTHRKALRHLQRINDPIFQ